MRNLEPFALHFRVDMGMSQVSRETWYAYRAGALEYAASRKRRHPLINH